MRVYRAVLLMGISMLVASSTWRAAVADPAVDLLVTVSPTLALPGQPVSVTLLNQSSSTYTLPALCLFTSVHQGACDTDPVFVTPPCPPIALPIGPGQSLTQMWPQTDDAGNQVADGGYFFNITIHAPGGALVALCPFVQVGFTCSVPPMQYGSGSPGSGGKTPAISTVGGFPAIGSTSFQLAVTNALGGAQGVFVIGFAPANLVATWGHFLISPALPLLLVPTLLGGNPGAAGEGIDFLTLPIPNDAALLGFEVYAQCLVADPQSSGGIAASEGLRIVICQ